MANVVNTLYPPIVPTFLPAFVNTEPVKITFSLSPYVSTNDVKRIHISIVNQLNNENALLDKSGIISETFNNPDDNGASLKAHFDEENNNFFVTIDPSEINNGTSNIGSFNTNQFYKVQLRIDNCPAQKVQKYQRNGSRSFPESYYLDNQSYFSEWSTVCLIRPISRPKLTMNSFDEVDGHNYLTFNEGLVTLAGLVEFNNGTIETETLQSYKIFINAEDDKGEKVNLIESPTIYTGENINPNVINYRIDTQGLDKDKYNNEFKIKITCTTKNQYVFSRDWNFQLADFLDDTDFSPTLTVNMDNEEGIATLHIINNQTVYGTIFVKRTSSESNFKKWENIYAIKVPLKGTTKTGVNLTINDNTVQSLSWYKYSVQFENVRGGYGKIHKSEEFMPNFYDAIISRGDTQLKITYDYNISSMKPNVNRAKIDTLGSKYPKFAENAILNYKQFSINGTISSEADANRKFMSSKEYFYGNEDPNQYTYNHYKRYKKDTGVVDVVRNDYQNYYNGIVDNEAHSYLTRPHNDWLWERIFREEVVKWLNDGEPKLYRSMTEGNLVVMLTDISLTPNKTLGRRLYSFSATMYEIAEANSLSLLDSLGIYTIVGSDLINALNNSIDEDSYVQVIKVGQLFNYTIPMTLEGMSDNDIVRNIISSEFNKKYSGVLRNKKPGDYYLKDVKIYFQNKHPDIYYSTKSGSTTSQVLVKMTNEDIKSGAYDMNACRTGFTFSVNTKGDNASYQQIFVNERRYHQLPSGLNVYGLSFNPGDIVTVEYLLVYKERDNSDYIAKSQMINKSIVGQERGVFNYNEQLNNRIRNRYSFIKYNNDGEQEYYLRMQYWSGICLDVEPFAIARIKYQNDDNANNYIVGKTGVLHMLKDTPVSELSFVGRRMIYVNRYDKDFNMDRQPFLDDWEFTLDDGGDVDPTYVSNDNIAYWNQNRNNPVSTYVDSTKLKYSLNWNSPNEVIEKTLQYSSISDILTPKRNTVYNINGELQIYYKGHWYPFTNYVDGTGIAEVPIEGIVNYGGDIVKVSYE